MPLVASCPISRFKFWRCIDASAGAVLAGKRGGSGSADKVCMLGV